jgi:hypothetical protein
MLTDGCTVHMYSILSYNVFSQYFAPLSNGTRSRYSTTASLLGHSLGRCQGQQHVNTSRRQTSEIIGELTNDERHIKYHSNPNVTGLFGGNYTDREQDQMLKQKWKVANSHSDSHPCFFVYHTSSQRKRKKRREREREKYRFRNQESSGCGPARCSQNSRTAVPQMSLPLYLAMSSGQ